MSRRYLITALPPLLLGLCIWISRGGPRPRLSRRWSSRARVVALVTLPAGRFVTAISADDVIAVVPFGELAERGDTAFRLGLLAFGLVLGGDLPRASSPLPGLDGREPSRSGSSCSPRSARGRWIGCRRSSENARVTGDLDWIDRDARIGCPRRRHRRASVDVDRPHDLLERVGSTLRANRRRTRPGVAAARGHDRTGRHGRGRTRRGSVRAARRRADDARAARRGAGRRPHLPSSRPATPSGGSTSRCSSSRAGPGSPPSATSGARPWSSTTAARAHSSCSLLGKDGLPVRITVNGLPWLTVQPEPGGRWTGSIPSLRSGADNDPCLFQLESEGLVGSTRVEWMPRASRLPAARPRARSAPRSRHERRRPRTPARAP